MMTLTLPKPIKDYLLGSNAGDASAVAAAFLSGATVRDEGKTHIGREAILAWAGDTIRRYHMQTEPLCVHMDDDVTVAIMRLTGDFPASPVQLQYRFKLGELGIRALEVVA